MFVAAGPTALGFCEWVDRLEARTLLAEPQAPALRTALEAACRQGALISIDLGVAEWIRAHGSEGCTVFGRRLVAPAGSELEGVALAAALCVAFMEGAAPVDAARRAVLVAARLPATTTRGHGQQ